MSLLLSVFAVLMLIFGTVKLLQRDFLSGVALIVVGLALWIFSGSGYV